MFKTKPIIVLLHLLSFISFIESYASSADSLLTEYSKNLKSHKHFYTDFTQYRYISMFTKPLVSTGTIFFSYPDKILFHYKTPSEAKILLSNNKMRRFRVEEGKNIEQSSIEMVSKPIVRNIMHFFKGDFVKSRSFTVEINKNKARSFILAPSDAGAKSYFSTIEISFSENLQYIEEIKLTEKSSDYILVKNEQPFFRAVPDSIFTVK